MRTHYRNGDEITLGSCDGCTVCRINGVLIHESGCPESWRDYKVECKECGCEFWPDHKGQQFCGTDCYEIYNGIAVDEALDNGDGEGEDDWDVPEAECECPNCRCGTIGVENGRLVCRGECGHDFGPADDWDGSEEVLVGVEFDPVDLHNLPF